MGVAPFLAHQSSPVAGRPTADLDRLACQPARDPAEARLDPALLCLAGDDRQRANLAGRKHLIRLQQHGRRPLRLLPGFVDRRSLPLRDGERDRVVESLQVRAGGTEGVVCTFKTNRRRRTHLRRQIRVARPSRLERARVHDHRPAITVHQLVRQPGCALDARRRLQPAQQPSVPGAKLPEPGNLSGRSPRTIFHTGAENVSCGTLLMNRAADASITSADSADGTRTHDHLDHNQGLYQLSYSHRARNQDSGVSPRC